MSDSIHVINRRDLLRLAALAGVAVPVLGACAMSGGGPGPVAAVGEVSATNPLGVLIDKPVEVVIFDGGFGDRYATEIHEPMLRKKHAGLQVKHVSTKEIAKTLRPRFAGGNPPDFVNNDGADNIDFGALVADGQLADLTPLLDAPTWGDPSKKVRDTLSPAALEIGMFDGKFVVLPYVNVMWGIWYSTALFEERGWQVPATWAEFLALCEEIKAAGLAPFTYAGKYPGYVFEPLLTMAAKIGGKDVLTNIDNLEDGAWRIEPVRQAAEAWAEIGAKYLLQGTVGFNHTESQGKQNAGEAAMLPCGTWLENEQKSVAPADFGYAVFPVPSLSASDRMPQATLHSVPSGAYCVPARAANPRGGMEYMRAMLSTEGASRFTGLVGSLTTVKGATGSDMPPGLRSASAALTAAGEDTVYWRFASWYREIDSEAGTATGALMSGRIDANAFTERIQRRADSIKKNASIKKFRRG